VRHLLTDPAFPDIVAQWAAQDASRDTQSSTCANDNNDERGGLSDPLLSIIARAQIEATRIW
jgi:hypothetical protein